MTIIRPSKIAAFPLARRHIVGRADLPRPTQPGRVSLAMVLDILAAADGAAVFLLGLGAAIWSPRAPISPLATIFVAGFVALAMTNVLRLCGAYRHDRLASLAMMIGVAIAAWVASMVGAAALAVASDRYGLQQDLIWFGYWSAGATAYIAASRIVARRLEGRWRRSGRLQRTAIVLGAGPIGQALIQKLSIAAEGDFRIVGVYDDRQSRLPPLCLGYPILGTIDDLIARLRGETVDCVFVALPLAAEWRIAEILSKLSVVPVDIRLCTDNFGFRMGECGVSHVAGMTVLDVANRPVTGWARVAKAIEDKVLAAVILLLVAPIMVAAAVAIRLDSAGPVFFRQKRLGLNNRLIDVLKFRTLYHNACDVNAERLCTDNDPRVTRVGAFLRKSMIDELPQFINVLRGDMSIVGPRPHALAAKAGGVLYHDAVKYYDARHRVKPGITGWAQISGWRGETRVVEDIRQRVAHDLEYIRRWSLLFDLKIIVLTALGALTAVLHLRRKQRVDQSVEEHAVPVANLGRSRSAA